MNCLNNETIQAFLDNELTPEQKQEVESHIKKCTLCSEKVVNSKRELEQIQVLLSTGIPNSNDITIPEFKAPKTIPKRSSSKIIMFVSAAAIAAIIGISAIVQLQNNKQEKLQVLAIQELELMQQTSMNEQWQERTITITITDKDGNIVEQFITSKE